MTESTLDFTCRLHFERRARVQRRMGWVSLKLGSIIDILVGHH